MADTKEIKVGQIVDGYRFDGGDPSKQESWAPVDQLPVKQAMHPDFNVMDRFAVKNFSTSPEASVSFLKSKYPDMNFEIHGGEIRMKKASDKEWSVLDPATGVSFKDLLPDLADIGYDALSGFATTAGTVAGGVGGAVGGPPGVLAGGAAGGAATSGAMEGLKQFIGSKLGMKDNFSGTDIALATGLGAASPLLFGQGATARTAIKAAANPGIMNSLGETVAKTMFPKATAEIARTGEYMLPNEIAKAGGGYIGKGVNYVRENVTPAISEWLSGAPRETIKAYKENPGLLQQIRDMGGANAYAQQEVEAAREAITTRARRVGEGIETIIEGAEQAKQKIDLTEARNTLRDDLLKAYRYSRAHPRDKTAAEKVQVLTETLDEKFSIASDPKAFMEFFGKPFMGRGERPFLVSPREAESIAGWIADRAKAAKKGQFTNAAGKAQYADKKFLVTMAKAGDAVSTAMKNQLPEEYSGLQSAWRKLDRDRRLLEKRVGGDIPDGEKAATFLARGFDNAGRVETLKSIDRRNQTNLIDAMHNLATFKVFDRPPIASMSRQGTTGTAKANAAGIMGQAAAGGLGATAGYWAGNEMSGGQGSGGGLGLSIGTVLGTLLGGPWGLKQMIRAGAKGDKISNALRDFSVKLPGGRSVDLPIGPPTQAQILKNAWAGMRQQSNMNPMPFMGERNGSRR